MNDNARNVRVFVSSIFRDMHAERDHFVTVVFPELRDQMERLGLEFYDVDLRWGIPETDVDGERANSWAYCKKWINRVEPFFICILGQRCGYVPPVEQVRETEDEEEYAGLSITEMEIRHAVLSGRIRRNSFFYFRESHVPVNIFPEIYQRYVDTENEDRLNGSHRPFGKAQFHRDSISKIV